MFLVTLVATLPQHSEKRQRSTGGSHTIPAVTKRLYRPYERAKTFTKSCPRKTRQAISFLLRGPLPTNSSYRNSPRDRRTQKVATHSLS